MYDILWRQLTDIISVVLQHAPFPDEFRKALKGFYTKLISMFENECIEMSGKGVRHLAKAYMMIEREALQNIPDFKNRCEEAMFEQSKVWESVVSNAVQSGEISNKNNIRK